MYRKLLIGAVVLALLGSGVWLMMRSDDADTKGVSVLPTTVTDATIVDLLPGTVLHVPVSNTEVFDLTIDTYILGGEHVLGGVTPPLMSGASAQVMVPDFAQPLPHGTWVYAETSEAPGSMVVGTTKTSRVYAPTASSTYQFVLLPVYVNFGGTGTFLMIALFSYDATTGVLTHRDLHFIDDRVVFEGFAPGADGTIAVHYLTRGEGDAMTNMPTQSATRVLRIDGGVLRVVE